MQVNCLIMSNEIARLLPHTRVCLFESDQNLVCLVHELNHHLQAEELALEQFRKSKDHGKIFWKNWDSIIDYLSIDVSEGYGSAWGE